MWFIGALQVYSTETGILTEGVPHRNRAKRGENNDLQKECSPISLLITLRYEVTKHLKSALRLASSNNTNTLLVIDRFMGQCQGVVFCWIVCSRLNLGRLASH
jgi:hypothetical protein